MIDEKAYYLIYKEHLQINKKKASNIIEKNGKTDQYIFYKERNSFLTNMLNIVKIRKVKIKL